jgi:hypothetical protein
MANKEPQEQQYRQFFTRNRITDPSQVAVNELQGRIKELVSREYLNFQETTKMEDNSTPTGVPNPVSLPFYKRKPLLLAVSLIVLAFIFLLISVFFMGPSLIKDNSKLRGELAYKEGLVAAKGGDGKWIEAETSLLIEEGMSIRVEGSGRAVINLDDGSAVRLNDSSIVTFSSMDPNHIQITNEQGEVYTRVMPGDNKVFDVTVGDQTYQALGTAYKTVCYDDVKGVEVYESKVKIIGLTTDNTIIVEQGNKYFVVNLNDPDMASTILEIDPASIKEDSFVMWNKDLDAQIAEFKNKLGVLFDVQAPFLFIATPERNMEVNSPTLLISGTTEVGAKVFVNGIEVTNNEGSFTYEMALNPGENTIKIKSVDSSGNYTEKTIEVEYNIGNEDENDDNDSNPEPTQAKPAPTNTTPSINLWSEPDDDAIKLKWEVKNLDTSNGLKIVIATTPNPSYPANTAKWVDGSTREFEWKVSDGKTYYFRICRYTGSGCDIYSNNLQTTAPLITKTPIPTPADVHVTSLAQIPGTTKVSWNVEGYSPSGFKVVWSLNENPVYPNRSGDKNQYFSDPSRRESENLDAFTGPGDYFVRVCAYFNGACLEGSYSNQIQITLE